MRSVFRYSAVTVLAAAIVVVLLSCGSGAAVLEHRLGTGPVKTESFSAVCASDDQSPLVNDRAGASSSLVPSGAIALTVCRYNGLNATALAPQFGLAAIGTTDDQTTVSNLAGELDALKPTTGTYNCPSDDGSAVIAYFTYTTGVDDIVKVGLAGCNAITNAHITRLGLDAPVVGQLQALTRAVKLKWARFSGQVEIRRVAEPDICTITQCPICPTNCKAPTRVVAFNAKGDFLAQARLHDDHFSFRVATPGRYTLKLEATNKVLAKVKATARRGKTTRVVFRIDLG